MIGGAPESVIILSDEEIDDIEDDIRTKIFVNDTSNHKPVSNLLLKDLRAEICKDFVDSLPDIKTTQTPSKTTQPKTITKRQRPSNLKNQTGSFKRIKLTLLKDKPISDQLANNELSDVSSKESLSDLDVLSDITSDDDSLSTISDGDIIEVNDSDDEILSVKSNFKLPLLSKNVNKKNLAIVDKIQTNSKSIKNEQFKSNVPSTSTNCNKMDSPIGDSEKTISKSARSEQSSVDKNKTNSKRNKSDQFKSSLPSPENYTELYLPVLDKNKIDSKANKSDKSKPSVSPSLRSSPTNCEINLAVDKNNTNPKCNKNNQSKLSVATSLPLSPTNLSLDENNTNSKYNKSDHSKPSTSSSLKLSPKNCNEMDLLIVDRSKTNSKCTTTSDQSKLNVPLSAINCTEKCNKRDQSKSRVQSPKICTELDLTIDDTSKTNSKCTKSDHFKSSVSSSLPSSPKNLSIVDQSKNNSMDNKNNHKSSASSSLQLSPKNCTEKNKTNSKCNKSDRSKSSVSPSLPLSPSNSIENDWQIVSISETCSKINKTNHSKSSGQSSLPLSPKNRKDDAKTTHSKRNKHDQSNDLLKIANKSKTLSKHEKERKRKRLTKKDRKKTIENNNDEGKPNKNNNFQTIANAETENNNNQVYEQIITTLKKELCQTQDEIEMLQKNQGNLNGKIGLLEEGLAKGAFDQRSPDNVQNCVSISIMDTETNEKSSDDSLVNLMSDKPILSVDRRLEERNLLSDNEDDYDSKLIIDEDAVNNSMTEEFNLSPEGHHEEGNQSPRTSEHDRDSKTDAESNDKASQDSATDELFLTLQGIHGDGTLESITKETKEKLLQTELTQTMDTLTNHQNWPNNNCIHEGYSKTFQSNECQTDSIDYPTPINIYIKEAPTKTYKTIECQTDSIDNTMPNNSNIPVATSKTFKTTECQTDSIENAMPIVNTPKQQWSQMVQTDFANKEIMCQTNVSYRQCVRTFNQFMASINENQNHQLKHIFSSNLLRLFVKSYMMYLTQIKINNDQLNTIENIETEVDLIFIIQSNHENYREQISKYFLFTFRELFIMVNDLHINDQVKFCQLLAELTAISVDNSLDQEYLPTAMHYAAYFTLENSVSRTLPVIGKTLIETKGIKLLNLNAFKPPSNEECESPQYQTTFQNQNMLSGDTTMVSPNQQSTITNQSTNTVNTIQQTQCSVPSTSRQSMKELTTQKMQTTEQYNTFNTTGVCNAQNQFQSTQNETFFLVPQDNVTMAQQNFLSTMMVPNQQTTANQLTNPSANTINIIQTHCSMPATIQQPLLQFSAQQMQITDQNNTFNTTTVSNAHYQSQQTQNQPLLSVSQKNLTISQQNMINGDTMMANNQQSATNQSTNTINIMQTHCLMPSTSQQPLQQVSTQLLRLTDQQNTFNATTVSNAQNQMQPPQNPPTLPQQKKLRKISARPDGVVDQIQQSQQNGQLKQLLNKPPQQLQQPDVTQQQQWLRPTTQQQMFPPSMSQPVYQQHQTLPQPQQNQNQATITPRQFAIDEQSIATQKTYYQVLHGKQQSQLQPEQMPLQIASNRVPQQQPFSSSQLNQNQVPIRSRPMSLCEPQSSMPQQQYLPQLNQNQAPITSRRMSVCAPQQTTQTQVNNSSQSSIPEQQYSPQLNQNQVPIRSRRMSVCDAQQTPVNNLPQSTAADSQPLITSWHTPQLGEIRLMGPPAAPRQRKPMHLIMGGNPATNKGPK